MKTKILTFGALMTALALGIMAVGAVLPTMRLALAGLAGLAVSLVLIRCGPAASWLSFAAAALLSLLLLPHKISAICFALFLGWYPLVKWLCELLPGRFWEWLAKLAAANAAITAVYLFFTTLLPENVQTGWMAAAAWAGANAVFVVYDLGLSQWLCRIQKLLKEPH